MSTKHEHVIQRVDDYLHGLLAAEDVMYLEQHCEQCPICEVALREARKRYEAMQTLPQAAASERLIAQTLLRVEKTQNRDKNRWQKWVRYGVLPVAASIVLLLGLEIYYQNLQPSPYDLKIVGQKELLAGAPAALRVQLNRRDSASPVSGVPVNVELTRDQEVIRLASFTTDDRGSGDVRFRVPDWASGNCDIKVVARTRGGPDAITRSVAVKRSWQVMLSTDKPVYQPGQTIRMRSLALRKLDLQPVVGTECVFLAADPKGNIVFKNKAVTSKFGISAADFQLADEIIEGDYSITCRVGDSESKATVEVKKYVLPKFKVEVQLDRPFYAPGDRVTGTINAGYFFGKPVGAGQAKIEVRSADAASPEIANIVVQTDATGSAPFSLVLPRSLVRFPHHNPNAQFTMQVRVTDSAGQEESTTVSRIVTSQPLRIEVIPESGELVRGVSNTVYLLTTYADGRPARTGIAVAGEGEQVQTDEQGLGLIEITPQQEQVTITISARDSQGVSASRSESLTCGKASNDYLVRLDRAVYEGGQTAKISVAGGGNQPVFIDFIRDGQIMLTTVVPVTNGKGDTQVDLPPELFGTVQVHSYRFGSAGLANRKSRVIYIEQARKVAITARLDRPEYRPGEQARLQIDLKDDQGRPAPGAVSLAAVDEAVFSVLSQRPGMEQTFFNLEQQLLQPIYAIYPWSPDLATSKNGPTRRDLLNLALFAKTAKSLGAQRDVFERLIEEGAISPRSLEVLDSEFLEDALKDMDLSNELRQAIQGDMGGTFTDSSYPARKREVERTRREAMQTIHGLWLVVGLWVGIIVIAALYLWLGRSAAVTILVSVLILILLVSILLPSLSRARELSKRTVAWSELRSLDNAASSSGFWRSVSDGDSDCDGALDHLATEIVNRVREWFPETLLWRPEIITDDQGRASIDVPLADSITTWRLTGSAITGDGRLGGLQSSIRVFQPFFVDLNLPVSLTRGDEVTVPVVVYNYLDKPQTVSIALEAADWFSCSDSRVNELPLEPGDVRSISYRIRATRPGRHQLQVSAKGNGISDAIKREIEVVPEGRRVEETFSGTLTSPVDVDLKLPADAIADSMKTTLRIYPSSFSQVVEGLDAIFQMPYGCFEQTSSTTYPNVLALDYLRKTGKNAPQVEAKARQFINLGYQRLLTFEVSGGGFDWFGRAPANQTLTAYGLMEFIDMARVHDVDPNLIERTRKWLLSRRLSDGSWPAENRSMHDDPLGGEGRFNNLAATAYVAWAVFGDGRTEGSAATRSYLTSFKPSEIKSPYLLALVSNALLAVDPSRSAARPYIDQLASMAKTGPDEKLMWWQQDEKMRTTFYGCGRAGDIEATAMSTLALIRAGAYPQHVRGALGWLITQKDGRGTWHSTQATVLALKALLAGTGAPIGGEQGRHLRITCGNANPLEMSIPADQTEVVKQVDLTEQLARAANRVRLEDLGGAGTSYQLVFRYHVPVGSEKSGQEPLTIGVGYDKTDLTVGDRMGATATITNNMSSSAPMVIVDLPVPPGFAADPRDFNQLVAAGTIAKFEITPRQVIVYLRGLEPGKPLTLAYGLQATTPVEVTAPAGRAYEYYNPDRRAQSQPVRIKVRPRA